MNGDIVKVPAARLSSSHSSWWQVRNKEHGRCGDFVYKVIEHITHSNTFGNFMSGFNLKKLPITAKQIDEISKPRGKEKHKQNVDVYNFSYNELEVIGNIIDNKDLLK